MGCFQNVISNIFEPNDINAAITLRRPLALHQLHHFLSLQQIDDWNTSCWFQQVAVSDIVHLSTADVYWKSQFIAASRSSQERFQKTWFSWTFPQTIHHHTSPWRQLHLPPLVPAHLHFVASSYTGLEMVPLHLEAGHEHMPVFGTYCLVCHWSSWWVYWAQEVDRYFVLKPS